MFNSVLLFCLPVFPKKDIATSQYTTNHPQERLTTSMQKWILSLQMNSQLTTTTTHQSQTVYFRRTSPSMKCQCLNSTMFATIGDFMFQQRYVHYKIRLVVSRVVTWLHGLFWYQLKPPERQFPSCFLLFSLFQNEGSGGSNKETGCLTNYTNISLYCFQYQSQQPG